MLATAFVAAGIAALLFVVFRVATPARVVATNAPDLAAAPVSKALAVPSPPSPGEIGEATGTSPAAPAAALPPGSAEPKLAPSAAPTTEPVAVAAPPIASVKRVPGPLPASSKTKPGAKGLACKGIFCE